MKIAAKTDVGKVRETNQDAYATGEMPDDVAWAVICDGMGGAAGGNVASTTAVKIISEQITAAYRPSMRGNSIRNMLMSAINAANVSVYDMARSNEELKGMGTTVVCVVVTDSVAYIAHAGDSRAYLLSDGELTQLTPDHSRALGVHPEIRVDFYEQPLEDNDVLMLCTDGLTNYVDTPEICKVMQNCSYYEYAQELIAKAIDNGGGDNVTVVTLAY